MFELLWVHMLDYLNYKLCFSIIHFIITNFNNEEKIQYYSLITKLYKNKVMSCHIFSFFTISNYREQNLESYGIKIEMFLQLIDFYQTRIKTNNMKIND